MPTVTTTLEIPLELEYSKIAAERGARDGWGAPLEPDLDDAPELLAATVLTPAMESHVPAWRRTAPRRGGWYWLRRASGEPIIRRVVEVPIDRESRVAAPPRAFAVATPANPTPANPTPANPTPANPTPANAVPANAPRTSPARAGLVSAAAAAPSRPLPPSATTLVVLEPGEGPRSPRHVPVSAYTQVWQWAGPIPAPGAALPVTLNLAKLDRAERNRLRSEIPH